MFRFAMVDDTTLKVIDIATWDGTTVWQIPPGRLTYVLSEDSEVAVDWTVDRITNTFFQPLPVVPGDGVKRLSKIYFMRLFTTEETVRYNALRRQVTNLKIEDYADPDKLLIVQAEVFFQRFDATDILELEHPETQQGLGLLAFAGIFGADAEVVTARITAITAGLGPTGIPVTPEEPDEEEEPEAPTPTP